MNMLYFLKHKKLRKIRTVRSLFMINLAAKFGYYPLIDVDRNEQKPVKMKILQNIKTGKIRVLEGHEISTNRTYTEEKTIYWKYYPQENKSLFAAYLIPKNIKIGERVFVKDLINNHFVSFPKNGNKYGTNSCEAIWNGNDLIFDFNEY